ncbi:MAG TPA: hypothetical protein HA311_08925 [Candidatus Poseidoniaceae archaeon]|nr:hypothetical protein [Candidatus Poseidoniaceae archaeon]
MSKLGEAEKRLQRAVTALEQAAVARSGGGTAESEEAADTSDADAPDYASMTVAELKDELKAKGLPVSGKKAELVERLQSA